MFQSFPTITAPAVPSAPPPLVTGMKPNVSSIGGKNKSNDDSSDSLFDTKSNLNIKKFLVHILLKPHLENFHYYFASVCDEYNCAVV